MFKDKKVVFFDMGNTLLNFHTGATDDEKDAFGLEYLTEYLRKFSEKVIYEEVRSEFYDKWNLTIDNRKLSHVEYPVKDFLNGYMNRYGITLTLAECIEAIDLFYSEYRKNVTTENNLIETLTNIKKKGYKIGVISNSCRYDEVMINCFKAAGIDAFIDNYTFSYYLKIGKPRPEIFHKALKDMEATPKDCIMIGDSLTSDIKPAIELSLTGIWLNRKHIKNTTLIKPDLEISILNVLCDIL